MDKIFVVFDRDYDEVSYPIAAFTNKKDAEQCEMGDEVKEVRLFTGPAEVRYRFVLTWYSNTGMEGDINITRHLALYDGQVSHDYYGRHLTVFGWDLNEVMERFQAIQAEILKEGK